MCAMKLCDEVNELALFGVFGAWRDRDVNFVDVLGFAEIAERLDSVRSGEDRGTFPDPEAVNWS